MSLQDVVSADRPHIAFFGLRNAGKSSLVNAVTGQNLCVVSEQRGTTTDPVQKAMELLPAGPVVILDTPGIDDTGDLGKERVRRALRVLDRTDLGILVVDATLGLQAEDQQLLSAFRERKIPFLVAYNKADLLPQLPPEPEDGLFVSAQSGLNVTELKERIARLLSADSDSRRIVADLVSPGDLVILSVPIDSSAPKGRLILPQQQTIRDLLDAHAVALVAQPSEIPSLIRRLNCKPRLVITDSQAFGQVNADLPAEIPLTSFSILFARYKGSLESAVRGAAKLARLQDGDTVLIAEGCTHHRQCEDIGTVKLPAWIRAYTGKDLKFDFTSGRDFPEDLSPYALAVHCGGCMLNEREVRSRVRRSEQAGLPITNYGVAIAQMHGILARSLACFPDLLRLLDQA